MAIKEGTPVKVTQTQRFTEQDIIYVGTFLKQHNGYFTIITPEGETAFRNDTKIEVIK
jgi:hypothetical protein